MNTVRHVRAVSLTGRKEAAMSTDSQAGAVNDALAAAAADSRREAVRTALQRKFGRAITVTGEMIDSVLEGLQES